MAGLLLDLQPFMGDERVVGIPAVVDEAFRVPGLFVCGDLDEASALFEGAAHEQTWDTESLAHHRRYPDDALVAHERLQVEEEARHRFFELVVRWQREGYA
ncbi:MAG TPA: hypothetical protein VFC28_05660, partial [Opitutaceae bacterium]|nr:hypothetical protein [Opitutaceae bacterium]